MGDVVFVLVTITFFAVCWLFVRGCDRIVRSQDDTEVSYDEISDEQEVAA